MIVVVLGGRFGDYIRVVDSRVEPFSDVPFWVGSRYSSMLDTNRFDQNADQLCCGYF